MAWKSEYIDDNNDQEERDYELWDPEEGDTLQGRVTKIEEGFYEKKQLYIKTDDEETIYRTKEAGGLDWQIKKLKIEVNDIVHLEYRGIKETGKLDKDGEPITMHDYKLMKWEEE